MNKNKVNKNKTKNKGLKSHRKYKDCKNINYKIKYNNGNNWKSKNKKDGGHNYSREINLDTSAMISLIFA